MEIDPKDLIEAKDEKNEKADHLNNWVAFAIALLAAFMGICSIKDGNVVQNMQQSQAQWIDNWTYYQAKNIRQDIYQVTADQMRLQASTMTTPAASAPFSKQADSYQKLADKENSEKDKIKKDAQDSLDSYNAYNFHDDQFDLSDATLSLAITLFAVTALTKKRWLYVVALFPAMFGILMGLSGLLGWKVHPDFLINPLTFLR